MKKIINEPSLVVEEAMEGFIAAHKNIYEKIGSTNSVKLTDNRKGKVSMVIGGGSGHEPLFSGFVGYGLADAAACGNVFASPNPNVICEAAKAVDTGKGILFIYGNYAGDNMNFDVAEEELQDEGIKTARVRVWDDIASAALENITDRRGIAGDVMVIKVAGGACDEGLELDEVLRIAEKARDATFSIGVATSPGTLPGNSEPNFKLADDEIEYGMGLHGEPGIKVAKMDKADVLTENLYSVLSDEMKMSEGDEVCVLVNGLGATTNLELGIIYRKLAGLLGKDGIKIHDGDLNSYCTSQEMGGFSITLMKLDDELKKYYDKPCYSPYYAKGIKR